MVTQAVFGKKETQTMFTLHYLKRRFSSVAAAAGVALGTWAALPPAWARAADGGDAAQPADGADELMPGEDADAEFVPGEILVGFRAGLAAGRADRVRHGLAATKIKEFAQIGVQHWRLPPGLTPDQAVTALSVNPNVDFAEPNYIFHASDVPNDPRFGELWGLHNTGQTGGTPGADIDALGAWGITTGSASVVVAVIDTGIDCNPEDLEGNIWANLGEIPDNGIDDDGNGYIDDVRGWNFAYGGGMNIMFDNSGHGAHVSGTIGGLGNNGIGVTGVNWTVTIMPLMGLNSSGSGTSDNLAEAILYAASFEDESGNKIVRVINASWGGGRSSEAMKLAIESSGALFVASAGNSGHRERS